MEWLDGHLHDTVCRILRLYLGWTGIVIDGTCDDVEHLIVLLYESEVSTLDDSDLIAIIAAVRYLHRFNWRYHQRDFRRDLLCSRASALRYQAETEGSRGNGVTI